MAHSRAVSVLYLLEPVGWLILVLLVYPYLLEPVGWLVLELLVSPYLLEPVGWLVLELLVSLTCWSQ